MTIQRSHSTILILIIIFCLLRVSSCTSSTLKSSSSKPTEITKQQETFNSMVLRDSINMYYIKLDITNIQLNISFSNWNNSKVNILIKVNDEPTPSEYDYILKESDQMKIIANSRNATYFIGVLGASNGEAVNLYTLSVSKAIPDDPLNPDWTVLDYILVVVGVGGVLIYLIVSLIIIVACFGLAYIIWRRRKLNNESAESYVAPSKQYKYQQV